MKQCSTAEEVKQEVAARHTKRHTHLLCLLEIEFRHRVQPVAQLTYEVEFQLESEGVKTGVLKNIYKSLMTPFLVKNNLHGSTCPTHGISVWG